MNPRRTCSLRTALIATLTSAALIIPATVLAEGADCAARGRPADADCRGGDAGDACAHAHARANPTATPTFTRFRTTGAGANLSGR